jgi:NAD(P)-dependent dehydrogenase (short-subunit alcohol dehydrogenase family)
MNVNELFQLKNKTAIVTGATGLLGKQHCKALSEAGANVVVCDLELSKCEQLADKLKHNSIGVEVDITNKASVQDLLKIVLKEYSKVDILVNNAAINDMVENPVNALEESKFENYPLELFKKVMDVNVTGMFLTSQIIGSSMAERSYGSIINIASTYGIVAPDQSIYRKSDGSQLFYKSCAYPVSKAAVISLTKFSASYWGKNNVRVNSLSPGGVENNQDINFIENYNEKTPLGRMSKKNEYKGAIVFLASDASSYMTGANLVIDGGWTIW